MDPMASIMATTKHAAELLGWEDQVGTLESGKLADLIVCAVNPLQDIKALGQPENIKLVMKDGAVLKNID